MNLYLTQQSTQLTNFNKYLRTHKSHSNKFTHKHQNQKPIVFHKPSHFHKTLSFPQNPRLDKTSNTMNSFTTTTPNFDNLLLQTLMGRLQLRPHNNPTLEDLLFNATEHFSDFDSDDDDSDPNSKTQLAKEESKLEKEIIRIILSGKTETLKPNSGQAVSIGEHHICVGFHEEKGSDYRVWEWHGHVMLFDEENGYSPEYIYGNYFERTVVGRELKEWHCGEVKEEVEESEEEEEEEEEKVGLRELIEGEDSVCARIVHRNVNKSSPRLG